MKDLKKRIAKLNEKRLKAHEQLLKIDIENEINTGSQSIKSYLTNNGRDCMACSARAGKNQKHDFDNKIEKFNYAYQLEKHHIKATKEL